jgi:hypothetical protein
MQCRHLMVTRSQAAAYAQILGPPPVATGQGPEEAEGSGTCIRSNSPSHTTTALFQPIFPAPSATMGPGIPTSILSQERRQTSGEATNSIHQGERPVFPTENAPLTPTTRRRRSAPSASLLCSPNTRPSLRRRVDAAVRTQLSEDDLVNSDLFRQLLDAGIATALRNYGLEPAIPDPAPERAAGEDDPPNPGGSLSYSLLYLGLRPALYTGRKTHFWHIFRCFPCPGLHSL